jgi:hypothetical protein
VVKNFKQSEKEIVPSGIKDINTIKGLVTSVDLVPAPATWTESQGKIFCEVKLDESIIIKTISGKDPDQSCIKEGKFSILYPYGKGVIEADEYIGDEPSSSGAYIKALANSAARIGTTQTFQKIEIIFGKDKKTGEPIKSSNYFAIVASEKAEDTSVIEYVKAKVTGLTKKAAFKEIMMDDRIKQFPIYKEKFNDGTLADALGLIIVDEKFVVKS